jgi:hypothetical protein
VVLGTATLWHLRATTPMHRRLSVAAGGARLGVGLVLLAPALILLEYLVPSSGRWATAGMPGKSVAAALLLLAAAVAWTVARLERSRRARISGIAIPAVLLLASVESFVSLLRWFVDVPVSPVRMDFTVAAAGGLILLLGVLRRSRSWSVAGGVAVLLSIPGWLVYKSPVMQLLTTVAAAGLLLAAIAEARRSIRPVTDSMAEASDR